MSQETINTQEQKDNGELTSENFADVMSQVSEEEYEEYFDKLGFICNRVNNEIFDGRKYTEQLNIDIFIGIKGPTPTFTITINEGIHETIIIYLQTYVNISEIGEMIRKNAILAKYF